MFTLDDDTGNITIDFTVSDPENPEAEPSTVSVVVAPPPSIGAYKRLRGKIAEINKERDALTAKLRDDDTVGVSEMTSTINEFTEDKMLEWWTFVMRGDHSYRGQLVGEANPPENTDDWPLYMIEPPALQEALAHWKKIPLAHGGSPAATTT